MNKQNNGKLVYQNHKTKVYLHEGRLQPYTVWEGEYVIGFYSVPAGLWARYIQESELWVG